MNLLIAAEAVSMVTCGCCTDLVVVIASIAVLSIGSNGQVFATSAIRSVTSRHLFAYIYC